jgi:hypothetical protein
VPLNSADTRDILRNIQALIDPSLGSTNAILRWLVQPMSGGRVVLFQRVCLRAVVLMIGGSLALLIFGSLASRETGRALVMKSRLLINGCVRHSECSYR